MNYTATLLDCQVNDADKREAETLFCQAVEAELGSQEAVAKAYAAYQSAFNAHKELPLPACASDAERSAVSLWTEADAAGSRAAFAGWYRQPDGAHFEIELK